MTMVTQTQYITKEIRIEVNSNNEICLIKQNQMIIFTPSEIEIIANHDIAAIVLGLAFNIQVINELCEEEKE